MLFIISKKGLFKLNICLNYICSCSLFAAGQVTVRTPYVRGYLRVVLVLIITNKQVKKSNLQPSKPWQKWIMFISSDIVCSLLSPLWGFRFLN